MHFKFATNAGGHAAPHGNPASKLTAAIAASFEAHVLKPFRTWKRKQEDLAEINKLTDRDLLDMGYSRAELRNAIKES
ncbi:MAG: DUF1127 domain-containing protein [Magnetospiraceae bacterium]